MKNTTTFKIELEVAASKVIHQFMTGNEQIEKQLSESISKAIENFDFEQEVEVLVHKSLREAMKSSFEYGKLRKLVEERTNAIYEKLLQVEFKKYENL